MKTQKAIVRQRVEELQEVTRTWFEWQLDGQNPTKTLVVEVNFDTDPNSERYDSSALDDIHDVIFNALSNETTMIVSRVRIVPSL